MRKIINVTYVIKNYLKVIFELIQQNGMARVTDIAESMHVSKATVSQTTNKMVTMGYVKKEKSKGVCLTASGKEKVDNVKERSNILDKFLIEILGVPKEISRKDAYLMEHILSQQTIEKISNYLLRKNCYQ